MSKASDLGYWVKDHGGVVFAAIMVVALVAMFVAAIVVSSQQPEAEPEDTVSGGYVGSWYHVEYDKAYVLTLNGDGTARYYDKTLVQPLMFGKWEVGENMKVSARCITESFRAYHSAVTSSSMTIRWNPWIYSKSHSSLRGVYRKI